MRTLRVGIDLTSLGRYPTGMVRYALELSRNLVQLEAELSEHERPALRYVLFFSQSIHLELLPLQKYFEAVICPLKHELWLKQVWFPAILPLAKLDVMHYPAFPPPFIQFHAPTHVLTFHDAAPWRYPETLTRHGGLYFRSFLAHGVRSGAWIITPSSCMRRELDLLLGAQHSARSVVIPEASSKIFSPDSTSLPVEKEGLPRRFFLMVGTVEPRKNVGRVIEAHQELQRRYGEDCPTLVLVGRKGWRCRELVELIACLQDTVLWLENVTDQELAMLYRRAICLVFPSLYEGFGLPVLEAMAAGCPVITAKTSAMAEIATDAARLVDPSDCNEIRAAMWQLWMDEALRRHLIEVGYRRAACFSWTEAAKKTRRFYLQVGNIHAHTGDQNR